MDYFYVHIPTSRFTYNSILKWNKYFPILLKSRPTLLYKIYEINLNITLKRSISSKIYTRFSTKEYFRKISLVSNDSRK